MPQFIVLAVYRAEVGGKASGSRDFQAILVRASSSHRAVAKVAKLKPQRYKNSSGEWVKWPLVDIMSCGRIDAKVDLDEIAGFIAGKRELFGDLSLKTPSLSRVRKP